MTVDQNSRDLLKHSLENANIRIVDGYESREGLLGLFDIDECHEPAEESCERLGCTRNDGLTPGVTFGGKETQIQKMRLRHEKHTIEGGYE